MTDQNKQDILKQAVHADGIYWWQMELPSGEVLFDPQKAITLGFKASDFVHYTHFTNLVHPEDYDEMMKAMQDHLEGKKEHYEVTCRIKAKNGQYKKFYDKGKIIKKDKAGNIIISGTVANLSLNNK